MVDYRHPKAERPSVSSIVDYVKGSYEAFKAEIAEGFEKGASYASEVAYSLLNQGRELVPVYALKDGRVISGRGYGGLVERGFGNNFLFKRGNKGHKGTNEASRNNQVSLRVNGQIITASRDANDGLTLHQRLMKNANGRANEDAIRKAYKQYEINRGNDRKKNRKKSKQERLEEARKNRRRWTQRFISQLSNLYYYK